MMRSGGMSQTKPELVAIDRISGTEKWKVAIDAEMVSEPAFAKDGRLFVTASDVLITQSGSTIAVSRKARLLVIKPAGSGASVASTDVESDVLSAPRIAPDESVVYATGFEMAGFMSGSNDNDSIPAGQSDLYAFSMDGTRRFKVTIGRAQFNMPPGESAHGDLRRSLHHGRERTELERSSAARPRSRQWSKRNAICRSIRRRRHMENFRPPSPVHSLQHNAPGAGQIEISSLGNGCQALHLGPYRNHQQSSRAPRFPVQ